MASNETILAWKAELQGAENVKDGLRKINAEVKANRLDQIDANKAIQAATKDTRNFRAEQNLLQRSFQASHPQLTTLTRAMSTLSNVARAGMNIATTLNTMWIRQSLTQGQASEITYELGKAQRDLNKAILEGDLEKQAEIQERINVLLEKQANLPTADFWTNLIDVITTGSTIATAVTLIFTNLMKNPIIAAAVLRVGGFIGSIFSGAFTLAAKGIAIIADWLFPSLTGKNAMKGAALAGTRNGTVFGLSWVGGVLSAISGILTGALLGVIIFPTLDEVLRKNSSWYDIYAKWRDDISNKNADIIFGKDSETKKGLQEFAPGFFGPGGNGEDTTVTGKTPDKIEEEVSFFQPLIDLFTKTIPDALKTTQEWFGNIFKGITELTNSFGSNIVSGVNNIFKSLIDSMNQAIASYNRAAKKMNKSTISSLSFNPATFTPIPMPSVKAATGFNGMINRPTVFLAGEAGPEQVSITPNGNSNGGGITVVVNVQGSILTERELFRRVDENLKNELKKRNFRLLQ